MRTWIIITIFSALPLLLTTEVRVAAAADRPAPEANELLEQVVPNGLFRDLYNQALSTLQEYVELEGHLPGEGSSRQQAGEFRLKLFPQGKSRSQEHVSAEGSYRLAPEDGQREFTLRFKSSGNSRHPALPTDAVI